MFANIKFRTASLNCWLVMAINVQLQVAPQAEYK